jgi:hypothetical protein
LAAKSNTIISPWRAMSTLCNIFTGDFAWHSAERKAEKSCSPNNAELADCMATTSSGW